MKKKLTGAHPIWLDGLVIPRIFAAWLIILSGRQLFDPNGMKDLVTFLTDVHVPFPELTAKLAKGIEFFGGFMLAIGLFTRVVSIALIIVMIGVTATMGGWSIFNDQMATLFMLLFIVFLFAGAGKWSLDYWLFNRQQSVHVQN